MRFVFDTSVLIDYLRDDEMATNALFRAVEIGSVFISLLTLMELWLPDRTSFSIRDARKVHKIVLALNAHSIAEDLREEFYDHDYSFLDQPSVEVRTPDKRWQVEWDQEQFDVRLDPNGILTVFPHQRNKQEILREIRRLREFPGIQVIPCSTRSQEWALQILEYHLPVLGQKREQNSLIDSMLIATGITRRAYLVTNEIRKWGEIARRNRENNLPFPTLEIISPDRLVQEF